MRRTLARAASRACVPVYPLVPAICLLATSLVAACSDDGPADGPDDGCFELADGRCVEETFRNPAVLQPDENGVHELSLGAVETVIDGQRHCVRAYNGAYLAPTIETPARDGDAPRKVRVNLANRLLRHAPRSLEDGTCTCTDASGVACERHDVHDACGEDEGEDCTCVNSDGEECEHLVDFNVTNLHAHGSHVRPDFARGGEACAPTVAGGFRFDCRACSDDVCGDDDPACFHGDNVLNAVHPNTGAQYRWDIDEDGTHHAGMQWYHPHIHGTTAIQVASGAAGAWIVRGELDALPGVADARERVMLFSTPPIGGNGFEPLADGVACTEDTITFDDFATLGDFAAPQMNVLNGVRRPRLVTAPGQVERWRILHAGYLDEVFLGLFRGTDSDCTDFSTAEADTIALTQIGRDGLILPQPFEHQYVFMSPGYRVEAVLGGAGALADGETWCLVAARFLQDSDRAGFGGFGAQPMSPPTPPRPEDVLTRFDADGDVVAILNVTSDAGAPTTTTLPDFDAIGALAPNPNLGGTDIDALCAAAADVTDPQEVDQLAMLQVGFWTADEPDPCACEPYNVNCNNFELTDRSRHPFDRDLPLGAVEHWRVGASVDGHPFHIHINPYVVCPSPDVFEPIPFPHFRDTFLINTGRTADVITQNRAFTGPFVFHCHKLTHEDHGMMEIIRVCDPATDDTCGDYAWNACDGDDLECIRAREATLCAMNARNPIDAAACVAELGGTAGVCGPNACVSDDDCGPGGTCTANVCAPGGPPG